MPTLGAKIITVRDKLSLPGKPFSQLDLAHAVGEGRQATVSAWENNKSHPSRGTMKLIADLTDKPEEVFSWLCEDGPMPSVFGPKGKSTQLRPTSTIGGKSVSQNQVEFIAYISQAAAHGESLEAAEVLQRYLRLMQ